MGSGQHGGSANISGVIYQTLWCLLRALQIRVRAPIDSNVESEALLVLEPKGGGGDVRVGADVEQLKAKSDAGTWSLQTIINDVLPDLFMAAANDTDSKRFRFVTEGTMGDWDDVYRFFRRLENVEPPADIVSQLDDKISLRFRTARRKSRDDSKDTSLFQKEEYPELAMFCLIADVLKSRPAIKTLAISDAELHRRLWRLLGAFEFVGGQNLESVAEEIDRLLLAVVDRRDSIPATRAALAQSLMELSAEGNKPISAEELLAQHNLNATPLTDWSRIRSKSQDELQRILARNQYDTRLDVRLKNAETIASEWANSPRTLVVTGESGQGKTWTLAGIATCASHRSAPVLWVDATGNTREDLDRAAHQFWLDIRGGQQPIPLRQISSNLSEVVPSQETLRLRLCLDNVTEYEEAKSIVRENWPSRGISVAMSCRPEFADWLRRDCGDGSVAIAACEDFTWEELHNLLVRRMGDTWTEIPKDVRETLRHPLLASIYLDELEPKWHPTNEYELYSQMWRRLSTRQQIAFPRDVARLELLSERVLSGEPYPWTSRQLLSPEIDDASLQRLERCGWLRRAGDDGLRIFHDRLLNWAVAQSLFTSLRIGKRTVDDFVVQVAELSRREGQYGQVYLGYVPMDVLWLVCGDAQIATDTAPRLLEALEPTYGHLPQVLYRDLVTTLGERVAEPLFTRFRQLEGSPWLQAAIARALAKVGQGRIAEFARSLLTNSDPHVQRRGLKLAQQSTRPEILDEIWRIHVAGTLAPGPFLEEGEQDWLFREDSWTTLRKSAVHDPAWIVRQIKQADPQEPVHDLAWLIVNLPDCKPVWDEAKNALFRKVAPDRPRVLAACVGRFRDAEYVDWLREKLPEQRDLCGPVAIQSLSRIDPIEAAQSIDKVYQRDLHLTSSWSFREVWMREQQKVTRRLLEWADETGDSWEIGLLFRHFPNDVPADLFARMLDDFDRRLAEHLTEPEAKSDPFYREFDFIAELVSPGLVEVLERKRDTSFEWNLKEYLRRIGARTGLATDSLVREPGVRVLRRINGEGFTQLVNEYLQCDNRYGRLDAWGWSIKNPDEETFEIAADRSQSDELWEKHPMEQNDAIELLAVHGQWEAAAMGVARLGLQTQIELTNERLVPQEFAAEWLDELRVEVKSHPAPGKVMALAFAGNAVSDASVLHAILGSNPVDAELRHACIIGLEMLEDESDEGVRLVARHFDEHRYSVTRMLTQAGTAAAWDALWHDLQQHFDHITALNLMNLSDHADEVLELTTRKLPNQSGFGDWGLLRILIFRLRPELKQRLLNNHWLRETFHREAVADEGSSWLVGSKASAIECLAEFDSEAAYDAVAQALRTVEWHDRERYPYLLFKIDSKRAIPTLLDRLDSERSGLVRYAIGRVLSGVSLAGELAGRWESTSPEARASACFAASWADDGVQLESHIRRCLDDSSEAVIKAAIEALNRLRQRRLASELRGCVVSAEGLVVKWRYIDDMIDCMDPGDDFQPWPKALSSVSNGLSPVVVKLIDDRLKERRKKFHDELKNEKYEE